RSGGIRSGSRDKSTPPRPARRRRRRAARGRPVSIGDDGFDLAQPREHFLREEPYALFRLGVGHEAGAADQAQVPEPPDLVVELHHLLVDGGGVTREEDALGGRLLGGERREARRILAG